MSEFRLWGGPPFVSVIGITRPVDRGIQNYLYTRGIKWRGMDPYTHDPEDPLALVEFGGRVCYDSFHNPANKTRDQYIQGSIIEHNHGSVLEHVVVNFAVASVPRSTQLELVRHRAGMAFSWRSTRFTDNWLEYVIPPAIRQDPLMVKDFEAMCRTAHANYEHIVKQIEYENEHKTLQRKRIKEAARAILPNCLGSDGEVSMNLRALRHVIQMRTDQHADASIREAAHAFYVAALPYVESALADATQTEADFGVPQIGFASPKV